MDYKNLKKYLYVSHITSFFLAVWFTLKTLDYIDIRPYKFVISLLAFAFALLALKYHKPYLELLKKMKEDKYQP